MPEAHDIDVKFEGAATADHELDAEVAIAAIRGIQKCVRMLASAHRGTWTGDKRRFRAPNGVRDEVVVKLAPPEVGSYVLPMTISAGDDERGVVMAMLGGLIGWFRGESGAPGGLNSHHLEHLLRTFDEWLPKSDDLSAGVRLRGGEHLQFSADVRTHMRKLLETWSSDTLTIRGEVVRVYVDEGEVRVRYPPTGRTFRVRVPDDLRPTLTGEKGQWIEVQGTFRCTADGDPIDIQKLGTVTLPDLSPMPVVAVRCGSTTLQPVHKLELPVTLDGETHQLFVSVLDEIGLHCFAFSRHDLQAEIHEQVAFLWSAYVKVDPDKLAPDALLARHSLMRRFKELDR